jgi:polyisoprenoid-binding protein YceI
MTKFAWLTLAALLVCANARAQSVPWKIDKNHTHVGFTARHLGFTKVHGEFKEFSAKVEADQKSAKITKLEAEADTKSVNTDVEKRDNHLRSNDFFNAEKYPKLKLVMKSIQWSGNKFTATCALTLRDVTKDVKFEGELVGVQTINFGQGPQQRAAYEAHGTINRKDFGLNFSGLAEGVAIVSDNVDIEFETEISTPAK